MTDVATREDYSPEVQALLNQQAAAYADVRIQTPILKVCQAMTKEVKEGDAEAGEFLNTLTGDSYGTEVGFIVSLFQPGRSASSKDSRYFVSINSEVIPDSWADLVGEQFVGTRFDEHPDAEEVYKKDVNAGLKEWGKGPVISTTYNYTGLVLPPEFEGADADDLQPMPVRLTFQRTTKSAHEKIASLVQSVLRNKASWEVVFNLNTKAKSFGRNDAYIVEVGKGRATTAEERQQATDLAVAAAGGRADVAGDTEDKGSAKVAPEAKGALSV